MTDYLKQIITSQFEAALCMLHYAIAACPPEYWEGKIANESFRYVAYHTLFFVDLYLSTEADFQLRELHRRGGDERGDQASPGLSKEETLQYVNICRQKMLATIAAETTESLPGPSGFSYRKITRGELHIYNLRHVQHHAGAMMSYLRRVDPSLSEQKLLPWIGAGWRD
jgi:hypothetical protein